MLEKLKKIFDKSYILVFLLVLFGVAIYWSSLQTRAAQVRGCERANVGLREPLYQFLNSATLTRKAAAQETTGELKQINLEAVELYKQETALMISATSDHPQSEEKPYLTDCDAAFPKPFPLDKIDLF